MAHRLFLFNFFILPFLFATCNSIEPPPANGEKQTLALSLEDVSCTEAWIILTTTNHQLPATIKLQKNNQTYTFHSVMHSSRNAGGIGGNAILIIGTKII